MRVRGGGGRGEEEGGGRRNDSEGGRGRAADKTVDDTVIL